MNRMILAALLALGASCTLPHVARANGNGGSYGFNIGIGLNLSFSATSSCYQCPSSDCGFPGGGYQPEYNPYMGSPYGMSQYGGYPYGGYGTYPSSYGGYGGMSPYSGYGYAQGGYQLSPAPKELKMPDAAK